MDQILVGLGAAGVALLLIAMSVALWEHKRHREEVRRQLAWAENARDSRQAHARDMEKRRAGLTTASAQPARATAASPARAVNGVGSGTSPSSAAGAAALTMAAAQAAVTRQWIETEPMVLTSQVFYGPAPDFDPTQPADLSIL